MGSDGLFDNVHDIELEKLVMKNGQMDWYEMEKSKMLAQKIAKYALQNSENKKIYKPFARERSKVGLHSAGGKRDDITVISAQILPQ